MFFLQIAIFATVTLLVTAVAWVLSPKKDVVKERLESIRKGDVPTIDAELVAAPPGPIKRLLARLGSAVPAPGGSGADRAAAASHSLRNFLFFKYALMVALPLATAGLMSFIGMLRTPYALMAILSAAPVGLFGPNIIWALREQARKDAMRRALPDVLDLLVICVEAGMSLNTAFKRVAEKVRPAAPALADEFLQLHREIQAGRSREEALRALGERANVDELRALAAMMVQTDRMGTSIAKALRIHADGIRTKFHHEAEARAARATVKLAFPLVLCIFPALLVVIVGPAAVKIWAALDKLEGK